MKDKGKTFDYQLMSATIDDLDRIKKYKFDSIHLSDEQITEEETNKINYYIETNLPRQIENYKNIIFKGEIIGSYLVTVVLLNVQIAISIYGFIKLIKHFLYIKGLDLK